MADSPTTASLARRMQPTCFAVLLVLLLAGRLYATEAGTGGATEAPGAGAGTPTYIRPTRESIYQHLAEEMKAALGAEEHVRGAFEAVAGAMRDSVGLRVVPALQALVDGVVERAEDAWVDADEAGLTPKVKHCIDGAEGDAQQVTKRALDKIGGCIEAVDEEGKRRSREAARLLNAIEDVSKRFVLALETCIKDAEAKDAAAPESPSTSDTAASEAPPICPLPEEAASATPASAEDARKPCCEAKETGKQNAEGKKPLCAKCKKAQEEKARSEAEAASEEYAVKHEEKLKGKKGKEQTEKWKKEDSVVGDESVEGKGKYQGKDKGKIKDKSGKLKKDDSAGVEEAVEGKDKHEGKGKEKIKDKIGKLKEKDSPVSEESVEDKITYEGKDKGKFKKGKDGESLDKTGKAGKKKKDAEYVENANAEDNSQEVKEKKSKKSAKKEETKGKKGKNDYGTEEEKPVRRKRDLLSFNEGPDPDQQEEEATKGAGSGERAGGDAAAGYDVDVDAGASGDGPQWPTEGSTPEEQRVIACLSGPTMQPLVDEKTRAYQRLQSVLKRTSARQEEAPACVSEHVHKAELKVAAIKQRMAACVDRHMRQEL